MIKKMGLEEEIQIIQFGQGVCSEAEILAQFDRLNKFEQRMLLLDLISLVDQVEPTDDEMELASEGISLSDKNVMLTKRNLMKKGLRIRTGDKELKKSYAILLNLFKTAYQRPAAAKQGNRTKWWYRDLSQHDVAQGILTKHRQLVEEIYQHPSFRSEFSSIAKLRHTSKTLREAKRQEPVSEQNSPYHFVSYDEMITESIRTNVETEKYGRATTMLMGSLAKALSKQYGLEMTETIRVINDVIKKHLKETYHSDFDW